MKHAGWGLALAALLAGCGGVGLVTTQAARSGATFAPDAHGLAVVGSAQRIDFGRAPSGVISALDRELGKGRVLGAEGCPAAIVSQREWDGLVLTFTGERFVGWRDDNGQAGQICGVSS